MLCTTYAIDNSNKVFALFARGMTKIQKKSVVEITKEVLHGYVQVEVYNTSEVKNKTQNAANKT
jgi:hypothetical protein